MNLSQLPPLVVRSAKRVGRGIGSGKGGHTTGRGQKGQKSREDVKIFFEGTKMKKSLVKRLPFQRGKLKLKSLQPDAVPLPVDRLDSFPDAVVTVAALVKHGLVDKSALVCGVKILNGKTIKKALTVAVPASASAAKKITSAGGKIEL